LYFIICVEIPFITDFPLCLFYNLFETAQLLQEIQEYQRISYNYEPVEEIKTFLLKAKGFPNEDNFRLSLLVEPPSSKSNKGKFTQPPKSSDSKGTYLFVVCLFVVLFVSSFVYLYFILRSEVFEVFYRNTTKKYVCNATKI
jgi:hypothetical protein